MDIHNIAGHVLMDDPTQRIGQAYFNAAYALDPEWADKVRASGIDPFYHDRILPSFLFKWHKEHA